jgi:hypothetical protein
LTDTIAQFGILGQGSGFEGWSDLLVVVVLAVLWLAGGLVKTLSKKRSGPEGPARQPARPAGTWQERLVRKAQEIQRAAEAKSREMARGLEEQAGLREQGGQPRPGREPASGRAQPPAGRITIRQGPRGESVMVYERSEPQPPVQMPQAAREPPVRRAGPVARPSKARGSLPAVAKVVVAGPTFKPTAGRLPAEPAGFDVASLIDPSDPDALRKAILHYEILGKPLGMRDLFE